MNHTGRNITEIKNRQQTLIRKSIREAALSVLPVILIVLALCLLFVPVSTDLLISFLLGACLVIAGIGLFSLGAERSMTPIGNEIGTALTKTAKLPLILVTSFVTGFAVTMAEPDLQVLASDVPFINSQVLIFCVSAGVGFFMAVCMLRILKGWKLRTILLAVYIPIFVLAFLSDADFLPVAFDAGGVTTGPMTVPFILALGMGVSAIRSDSAAEADSFGLVGLSSAGPILVVLLLGFFYDNADSAAVAEDAAAVSYASTTQLTATYLSRFPQYLREMALALLPVTVLLFLFQAALIHMAKADLLRILVGLLYTYAGLVLFMTGVGVGFSPMGTVLGTSIAGGPYPWLIVPAVMLLGRNVIEAEPAVAVMERQIEEVSAGSIPGAAIRRALRIAVMLAMGCSAIRVLTGISLLWFIVPGYAAAFILAFLIPDIYTSIAFDSGGVASGPMTASFLLPFIMGACVSTGGSIMQDAFGVVSLVAMFPILSVEIVGLIYSREAAAAAEPAGQQPVPYDDYEIVELW